MKIVLIRYRDVLMRLACRVGFVLSVLLAWTMPVHAHECGPAVVSVAVGQSTTYTITGALPADYTVTVAGDQNVATISPSTISSQNNGTFTVTGTGVGSTSFSIFWKGVEGGGDDTQGTCTFTVDVSPPTADLLLEMSATPERVAVGGMVTLLFTARNAGPGMASGVVLSTALSPDLVINSTETTQGTCTGNRCELGSLDPGAMAIVTIMASVTNAPLSQLVQIGTVTSTSAIDTNLNNNIATVRLETFERPQLSLSRGEEGQTQLEWEVSGDRLQVTTNLIGSGTVWSNLETNVVSPYSLPGTNRGFYRLEATTNLVTPLPSVTLHQLTLNLDGQTTTNSSWGTADLTYLAQTNLAYFNLTLGDGWAVSNVPVVSVLGTNRVQTVCLNFPIGNDGVTVTNAFMGWSLTTNTITLPVETNTLAPVFRRDIRIFSGFGDTNLTYRPATNLVGGAASSVAMGKPIFPNQEQGINECAPAAVANSLNYLNAAFTLGINPADITSEKMKVALGWDFENTNGPPSAANLIFDSWVDNKISYMSMNNLPIETEETTDISKVMEALEMCHDVEMEMVGHAAAIVAVADISNGDYALTLSHDVAQGRPGGTVREIVIYDTDAGLFRDSLYGSYWSGDFITFVIERPKK